MKVERHEIPAARLDEKRGNREQDFALLSSSLQAAKRDPMNLSSLVSCATIFAGWELLFDPASLRGKQALRLAGRACSGLIAANRASTGNSVRIMLEEGDEPVTYTSRPDESTVNVGVWIKGFYLVTKDGKFGDALKRAVEMHKKYWSKKREYRMQSPDGFVSVPLTGLARMGMDQGLSFDVESPYVPRELLEE